MKPVLIFPLLILTAAGGCREKPAEPDAGARAPALEETRQLPPQKVPGTGVGQDKDLFQVPLEDSPTSGPSDASVTLVLFGDLADPASARVFSTLKRLHSENPDSVRWVFKHYPAIGPDPVSMLAAQAAVAAAEQGRFEPFADQVFGLGEGLSRDGLLEAGRKAQVAPDLIQSAWSAEPVKTRLLADRRLAARLAVRTAPALFINGRRLDPDAVLAGPIAAERKRAAELVARGIAADQLYRTMTARGRKSAWMVIRRPARPRRMEGNQGLPPGGQGDGQSVQLDRQTVQVESGEGLSLGKAAAPVQLIMFAELSCSFCGQMYGRLESLASKFPEDLRIQVRLLPDRKARKRFVDAAILLHALRREPAVWKLAPKLYLKSEAGRDEMLGWASELGLDVAAARRALAEPQSTLDALAGNRRDADAAGVRRSPYLFVNGRPVPGATSVVTLERMINEELKKTSKPYRSWGRGPCTGFSGCP